MAATTPTDSIASVSSPSARILYHQLNNTGRATVAELSETVGYDADRVRSLLTMLEERGLVEQYNETYVC